jgi:hypothetical protein
MLMLVIVEPKSDFVSLSASMTSTFAIVSCTSYTHPFIWDSIF